VKSIFILGASMLQIPAIKKAKEKGLYVYALDYDEHAEGIQYADEFLCISTIDKEAVLEAAKKYKPDYIITSTSDMPVRTVAWVNEQLHRDCDISYENAICATDKASMRMRMKECGVPIPEFHIIEDKKQYIEIAKGMGKVFVSKPADNAASRGVVLVDTENKKEVLEGIGDFGIDLDMTDEEFFGKIYEYSKEYSRGGAVLIEEFMTGAEVSVESITVNGETHIITITDKMVTEVPFFVETGHTEPSSLPKDVQDDIRNVATKAIKAIGIKNGPSHTEIKITKSGAKLVEIAARLGGDFITSKLVPLSTGVDLTDLCMELSLGHNVTVDKTLDQGSAIRFIFDSEDSENSSIIKSISGQEQAAEMPGVEEVSIYKKPGDKACHLTNSGDRIGHIIATGRDAKQAAERAEAAMKKITIIYQ